MAHQFWAVFASHYNSAEARDRSDSDETTDHFQIFDDEADARECLRILQSDDELYCAGMGPVTASTDWN